MRPTESSDIVIVGGGPGGLSAAESAARRGLSVTVVEQGQEIGAPTRTTGGSFIHDLQKLGIPAHLYHPIHRVRFVSPRNQAVFRYDVPVMCILDVRGVFQFLAERAADAGANIMVATTGTQAILDNGTVKGIRIKTFTGQERALESRILIDATGYKSSFVKQTQIHPGFERFGVGAEYDLYAPECDQTEAILIVGSQIAPSGYAWAFPWGRKRVRVGVGIIHKDSSEHPDAYLDILVSRAHEFGINLKRSQPVEYHFGLIPSEMGHAFAGNGIMAVGDAAGQASALAGEGIRWAMKAGRMAGEVAAEALTANDTSREFLSKYEQRWHAQFGRSLKIADAINKKISKWSDDHWDKRLELLKSFTPAQFGRALETDFSAGWSLNLLSNPAFLREGLKGFGERIGL